ncbi:MAG: helix-hairpin-helix domain-containing protein [Steroidobacteraceae bacterium]
MPVALLGVAAAFGVACLLAGGFPLAARAADAEGGRSLAQEYHSLQMVCTQCHVLELVRDTPRSYDAWHETVQEMVDRGATGTDQQFEDVMDYLHRTLTTIDVNNADADELEIVLGVSGNVAQAIIKRRAQRKFTGLADLESVPGTNAAALQAKARMIYCN